MPDAQRALLIDLYNKSSKHSSYQVLPNCLRPFVGQEKIVTSSRFERERWSYLLSFLDFSDAAIADIGGNTGYFTYEALDAGAAHVSYIEGNAVHAEFVKQSASLLKREARIEVRNEYLNLTDEELPENVDFVFLLNVLHHIGDDYGDKSINRTQALASISAALRRLSTSATYLIFQLGFNWKGNINLPLFETGSKAELLDFVRNATRGFWKIEHIGIAERTAFGVAFKEATPDNMIRDDSLGEFLNRPLLIMKSCNAPMICPIDN